MVLAGREERWKYVLGGPPTVEEERNMDSDGEAMAVLDDVLKDGDD